MKKLLYLIIILSFSNCNDRKEGILKSKIITDPKKNDFVVKSIEADNIIKDSLIKKSEPFKINAINCYWEFTLIIDKGEEEGNSLVNLKNSNTNKILLSYSDYCDLELYNSINKNNFDFNGEFKDVNFDGLKDFVAYSRQDSGSGGAFYNVYLFKKSTKTFLLSKELSGGEFEINTSDKTVSTYWKMGVGFNLSKVNHFDRTGKIRFIETTTREVIAGVTNDLLKTTYKKVVNGKIIKTKIDTTKFEGY